MDRNDPLFAIDTILTWLGIIVVVLWLAGCTVVQRNPMSWSGREVQAQREDEQRCSAYATEAAHDAAQMAGWRGGLSWMPLGRTPGLLYSTDAVPGPNDPHVRGQYYRACMVGTGYTIGREYGKYQPSHE